MKKSWRYLCKTSWRCLENVFARRLEAVLKRSWRCLEDALNLSWKRFEDVWKTYGQDEYIGLDQDVFWRHMTKANIFVLIKTSWRRLLKTKTKDVFKTSSWRLHQDECLMGIIIIKYVWICLLRQESEYASGNKYAKILNVTKFWRWQGSQYGNVTQRPQYARIWLDSSECILRSKYTRILNMAEFWICKSYTGP